MNSNVGRKYIGIKYKYSHQQVFTELKKCLSNLGSIESFTKKGQSILVKVNTISGISPKMV